MPPSTQPAKRPKTYDPLFAKKVVALLLRDDAAAQRISAMLRPQWIPDAVLADVADVSVSYVRKYGKRPTKTVLAHECGRDVMRSKPVTRLWRADVSDGDYVLNHFADFCREQALKEAVIQCAADLKDGRTDNMVALIQRAMMVGEDLTDLGGFLRDVKARVPDYLSGNAYLDLMGTGLPHLDEVIEGGVGPGEVMLVMAPTNRGKSFALMNVALNNVIGARRHKIVHYSFESNEKRVFRRYDKLISGRAHELLKSAPEKFVKALVRRHRLMVHGDVNVKFMPNKTCNIGKIKAHLHALRVAHDFVPDALVVDYLDEMRAMEKYAEKRDQLAAVARDLKQLAGELKVPIFSATQANRAATSKETIRVEDIAESYEKAQVADFIVTMCQTPKEEEEKQMRLFVAKARESAKSLSVLCNYDFARGIITSTDILRHVDVDGDERKKKREDGGGRDGKVKQMLKERMKQRTNKVRV